MATIEVVGTKKNGGVGNGPDGTVTVELVIRSPELGRMPMKVTVTDRMDASRNLEDARQKILLFAEGLREAAQSPLG